MPEFLTTSAITDQISRILIDAKQEVVLVSPFWRMSQIIMERLRDCDEQGVVIKIVYGINDLRNDQRAFFEQLSGLQLFYHENLHAKCYYNEERLVIGSMNLYDFSERNNREMGILLTQKDDHAVFSDALNEVESIIRASDVIFQGDAHLDLRQKQTGWCIRCREPKHADPSHPFCSGCFSTWVQFQDTYYQENYCHLCGNDYSTSMAKPLCENCFKTSV